MIAFAQFVCVSSGIYSIEVVIMFKKIKDSYNFSIPVLSLTIFLKFAVDIFYDIFSIESFGDSILFERSMLLALLISMGIHIYKNMNTPRD